MNYLKFYLPFLLSCIFSSSVVSCSEDDENDDAKTEAEISITYTLTLAPDLLKFVTPQVNYIDENGNLVTITGVEDLDNIVIENSNEIKKGGIYVGVWSKNIIPGTGHKSWIIKMKFNRLNFHSFMSVKYIRNDFSEDTSGKEYDFHHNINTSINTFIKSKNGGFKVYQNSHTSVTLKGFNKGDDIEEYLENLTNNPDKAGYFIDGDGNVTRRDE